jgi:hypothetical protein
LIPGYTRKLESHGSRAFALLLKSHTTAIGSPSSQRAPMLSLSDRERRARCAFLWPCQVANSADLFHPIQGYILIQIDIVCEKELFIVHDAVECFIGSLPHEWLALSV